MQRNLSPVSTRELEDFTAQYKVAHSGAGKRILSLDKVEKEGALVRGKETEDTIIMLEEVKSTPDSEDVRVEWRICCLWVVERSNFFHGKPLILCL